MPPSPSPSPLLFHPRGQRLRFKVNLSVVLWKIYHFSLVDDIESKLERLEKLEADERKRRETTERKKEMDRIGSKRYKSTGALETVPNLFW